MNIFQYAFAMEQGFKNYCSDNGYESFTTFYSDLTIAEVVEGTKGVKETHQNVMKSWLDDIKYITEYCMALNIKSWEMKEHEDKGRSINGYNASELGKLYADLYYKCKDEIYKHYKGNQSALAYFFQTTD